MDWRIWKSVRKLGALVSVALLREKKAALALEENCPRVVRFDENGALAVVRFLGER